MSAMRATGIVLIAIGIVIPQVIDAYETANHLDISRNVGSLPWLIMATIGAILVVFSIVLKWKDRPRKR